MTEEILRFSREITSDELADVLSGTVSVPTEKTGVVADLAAVNKEIQKIIRSKAPRTGYDTGLVEPLHRALKNLPQSLKLDVRMWQWMAIKRFPQFVWARWNGEQPKDIRAALARHGIPARFLGNRSSLRGRHRNALSRLFFAAETLYDQSDGYKLAGSAFQMQDRHTSLFEREMGLLPAAAKAFIRLTAGMNSKQIQRTGKRLNHIGSTIVFEFMGEKELVDLLR
jgi:hypothetical protein